MLATTHTVLCVDDDPDDQQLVLDTIREIDSSVQVVTAPNGVEALNFLHNARERNELPCLVLMDINMPLMDGKQALARIKKDRTLDGVNIVMFTTSSSKVDQAFCALHRVPFVTKPIHQRELQDIVRRLLLACAG
ncbi:MAG TPA: response regulator [Chitinophagaceae bacterium]